MPGYLKVGTAWRTVYDLQVNSGGAWRRAKRAYVKGSDGNWHPFFTYIPQIGTSITPTSPAPTALAGAPTATYTVSASATGSVSGSPVPAGVTVRLVANGAAVATGLTDAAGAVTLSWTPKLTGSYSMLLQLDRSGAYQPSASVLPSVTVTSTVSVVEASWAASMVIGVPSQFNGRVVTATGSPVGSATAHLFRVDSTGRAYTMANTSVSTGGSFSISWAPDKASLGSMGYYFKVVPESPLYADVWDERFSVTTYQPTPSKPVQVVQSATNTSVRLRVTDQANIGYFISRCTETGNTVRLESSGVAGANLYADWGLSPDMTYHFTVTAYSNNPTAGSAVGNTVTLTTGHPEVRDSGSAVLTWNPTDSGSWRQADGWSRMDSKLAQGYYTASYGPYYGVAEFNAQAMASDIDDAGSGALMPDRHKNLSVTKLEVYLSRVAGTGSGSGVSVDFYCAKNAVGGAQPTLGTSALGRVTGPSPSISTWVTLPSGVNSWLKAIVNNGYGLTMFANNAAQYSAYYGGSSFKIRATVSWNYARTAYQGPTYTNG